MREPGACLLIACYELGHQPLSVAWPAAVLERRGFRPAVLDVSVEGLDLERVRRARLVTIAVPMHTALRLGVRVAQRVRAVNPACHICFYGLYAALNADELLDLGVADSILAGEAEEALADLAERLERGQPVQVRPRPCLERLELPVPRRSGLPPLQAYAQLEHGPRRVLVGAVEASRGCKHRCLHCPIPPVYDGRFFVVPVEAVLADIQQLVQAGARHITFADPDFLNGPRHALRVARALRQTFPEVTFDITAKVEHLLRHRELLPELGALGCLFIVSAVESLSDTVLHHLRKGHTRADVFEVLAAVRRAGIAFRPTWVPFTPWSTLDDYREMLDFVACEGLVDHVDPVQYSIRLLVPPGSLLLESPALRPHLGPRVPGTFSYAWTHPDPRMDALQEAVARVVARAADAREDPRVTFARVRALAEGIEELAAPAVPIPPGTMRAPRLTEPWFC